MTEISDYFIYLNGVTDGMFMNAFLLTLYITLFLSMSYSQKRISGYINFAVTSTVAGFIVTGIATLLSILDNIVSINTVIICIIFTLLCFVWMIFERQR